jgi:small subunit ribosomal protein S20
MPVTKTAKRALRSSKRKEIANKITIANLEIAIRAAKRSRTKKAVSHAASLIDRAAKKNVFHKNKAARLKRQLSKFVTPVAGVKKVASKKKAAKKTAPKKKVSGK